MKHALAPHDAHRSRRLSRRRTAARGVRLGVVLCVFGASAASAQQAPPPPTVGVIAVQPRSVVVTATVPGRIVASAVAEVRPQVNGIITERLFEEGARVERGDPLYRIDPASYEAAVAQAKAAVTEARASSTVAEKEAGRVQELLAREAGTQQAVDQAVATRDVARAGIAVAEAQLQAATIELDRTTISAPLSGEIGLALTSRGALVTASQLDPLATIRNIDDVYVDITTSAARVLAWRREDLGRNFKDIERQVTLELSDGVPYSRTGELTATEPQVDEQTGAIVVRTRFPNPDRLLLPGMYVRVDIEVNTLENAFLIPQKAVSRDRLGNPTALVVNADDTVEVRSLDVRQARGNDWIVEGGLSAGDRVVLEGQQKAAPGTVVKAEPVDATGGDAPAGKAAAGDAPTGKAPAGDEPASDSADGTAGAATSPDAPDDAD